VTSFDVLQYADDDARALGEIARVLRRGGTLIMTAAALNILRGGHAAEWPEVRRYTRGGLRRVVADAGLRIERLAYLFGSLFPLMLAVRVMRRLEGDKPGDDWEMSVPAPAVNGALTGLLRAEAAVTRRVPLYPAGSSVLVVARKPS